MGISTTSKRITKTYSTGAKFSPCRTWRYALWRKWGSGNRFCVFIGLNPSTADETKNDPTVIRCIRFAERWGYDGLYMLNIFAYRETNPKQMMAFNNPNGPGHDRHLRSYPSKGELIVAAWGAHKGIESRAERVRGLATSIGVTLHCLGTTKHGHPRHPLYVRATTKPKRWQPREI